MDDYGALIVTALFLCLAMILIMTLYYALSKLIWKKLPVLSNQDFLLYTSFLVAFLLMGYNIGIFTGLSLTPVIQYVVPALLTFIAAFISYLFLIKGTNNLIAFRASWIIFVFNLGIFGGGLIGMEKRGEYEAKSYNQELKKELFLNKLTYYMKFRNDTGIQKISPPYIKVNRKDTAVIDVGEVPKF